MDEAKIRELTHQARRETDAKHAQEMQKFQADVEALLSADLLEALGYAIHGAPWPRKPLLRSMTKPPPFPAISGRSCGIW